MAKSTHNGRHAAEGDALHCLELLLNGNCVTRQVLSQIGELRADNRSEGQNDFQARALLPDTAGTRQGFMRRSTLTSGASRKESSTASMIGIITVLAR